MASHQTFSANFGILTGQTKFDQTNLLYIINGEVNECIIGKQMFGQFLILIISTVIILCNKVVTSNIVFYVRIYVDIRICLTLDIWPWFHFWKLVSL